MIDPLPVKMVTSDDLRSIVRTMKDKKPMPKTIPNAFGSLPPIFLPANTYN